VDALAATQRMTTPLRRDIFSAIMEAEARRPVRAAACRRLTCRMQDYINAFERVSKLALKGKQVREVISVLFDCCAQEKVYNPYYALLAQRLCESERGFAFTSQLRFWDLIKEMASEEMPLRRIANLARLLAHLITRFALSVAVLKGAPLEAPSSRQSMFLRLVFVAILDTPNEETVRAVFSRLSSSGELMLLRDALSIFVKQVCAALCDTICSRALMCLFCIVQYMNVRSESFPVPLEPEQRARIAANIRIARSALSGTG
jgi:nucleolar MIF4G domain-containing protein 1